LKSGLYARARIPVGTREALLVPAPAIVRRGQLTGLYRVGEHDIVTFGLVRVGQPFKEQVEILSGIKPGDRVITAGLERAVDGGVLK
jgi:multidrug efflux pump subunit AcrA (membrane-fusion protein)